MRALVLAPTRELALQVEDSVRTYGRHRPARSVAIYGGVGFSPQAAALRKGAPIVVATPGRLLDHVTQRTIDLSRVEILVLDEADRMLDMGFIRDIRRVLALLPARRQSLLFSATFSDDIRELAGGLLVDPAVVEVAPRNTAAELVDQRVIPVDRHRKRDLLAHLVGSGRITQALVFTRTKHGANRLAKQLGHDGIRAAAIHGNKSQAQRLRVLDDFKEGRVGILVATDLAARGLDIEALPHVVNYELPVAASDYIHRIGRTGRAGVSGQAVSLVCVDEAEQLRDIQRLLRRALRSELVPGFEPDRTDRTDRTEAPAARRPEVAPRAAAGRRRNPMSRPGARPAPAPRHAGAARHPVALPGERLRRALGTGPVAHPATHPATHSAPHSGAHRGASTHRETNAMTRHSPYELAQHAARTEGRGPRPEKTERRGRGARS